MFLGNRFGYENTKDIIKLKHETLIYVSFATVFNDKIDLFLMILDVFSNTKHNVIISTGNNKNIYQALNNINKTYNIQIYKFVDQKTVFENNSRK